MTAPGTPPVGVLAFATLAVFINHASGGNAMLAVLPALALAGLWLLWRAPLRLPLVLLVFLALTLDNPQDRPQQFRWKSVFFGAGELLHRNLHNVTGISVLRFSLLELLLGILVAVAVVRAVRASAEDGDPRTLPAFPLRQALAINVVALASFSAYGLLRGGDAQQVLWQIRQMAWMPLVAWIAMLAFRARRDQWLLAGAVVTAGLCRAAEGIYYYQFICRPLNFKPDYVTTHGDSLLFVTALMIPIIALLERPGMFTGLLASVAVPPLGLALVINNRRLAFVTLFVSFLVVAWSSRRTVRLWLLRLLIASLPLVAIYVSVGWNSRSKVFAPIASLRSAASSADTSNQTRDIENGNLIATLNRRPILGSGFGHPYDERVHAYDIQKLFPQYRYIAHNSVLWLWSQVGALGFALLWMPLLVGAFLALRSYRLAGTATARVAAMTSLTVIICYAGQAYGDMGLQSWTATLILSCWLGALARLAVATGAWPAHGRTAPLLGWPAVRMDARAPSAVRTAARAPGVT